MICFGNTLFQSDFSQELRPQIAKSFVRKIQDKQVREHESKGIKINTVFSPKQVFSRDKRAGKRKKRNKVVIKINCIQ